MPHLTTAISGHKEPPTNWAQTLGGQAGTAISGPTNDLCMTKLSDKAKLYFDLLYYNTILEETNMFWLLLTSYVQSTNPKVDKNKPF